MQATPDQVAIALALGARIRRTSAAHNARVFPGTYGDRVISLPVTGIRKTYSSTRANLPRTITRLLGSRSPLLLDVFCEYKRGDLSISLPVLVEGDNIPYTPSLSVLVNGELTDLKCADSYRIVLTELYKLN